MKQAVQGINREQSDAAAFGRLCVETDYASGVVKSVEAAAFGRLCVETS